MCVWFVVREFIYLLVGVENEKKTRAYFIVERKGKNVFLFEKKSVSHQSHRIVSKTIEIKWRKKEPIKSLDQYKSIMYSIEELFFCLAQNVHRIWNDQTFFLTFSSSNFSSFLLFKFAVKCVQTYFNID